MKNKKTFVGIALLIVVLVLGIAYAAITNTLTIDVTATASIDTDNFNVVFTGETTPSATTDGVTATATEGTRNAELNVTGLTTKDQFKTAKFKIRNDSDELKAKVNVVAESKDQNDTFFKVEATVDSPETELAPGDETEVTVKVTLLKTPVEDVDGEFTVTLGADAVLGD